MKKTSIILIGLSLFVSRAAAQIYKDGAGTIVQGVRPTYIYVSAGPSQMGVPVATITSLAVPPGATIAQMCVEGGTARYRDDGTAPTASLGIPAGAGCFAYAGQLSALQFIAQSGSPTIDVSYYK